MRQALAKTKGVLRYSRGEAMEEKTAGNEKALGKRIGERAMGR